MTDLNDLVESPLQVVSTPAQADAVLAIDVSHMAWRAYYANEFLTTSQGKPSGHVFGSLSILLGTLRRLERRRWCLAFCYDGRGAKKLRQQTVSEYKADRDPNKFNPVSEVKEVLGPIPGLHLECAEREGDDAMAWIAHKMNKPVVVFTSDKDTWALTKLPHVKVWSPGMGRYVEVADIQKHFHTEDPAKVYLSKALFGDASDNLKGVHRLQKKQITPLLNDPKVSDVDSLYENLDFVPHNVMTLNTKAKLSESREGVKARYEIVQPYLDGFNKDTVKVQPGNKEALLTWIQMYQCASLVDQIDVLFGRPVT